MKLLATGLLATLALGCAMAAQPQDQITKVLAERIPQLQKVDSVTQTPMKGLYEVRVGTDIYYTNVNGDYLIQGELIDTRAQRNLTEDRINQLTAIDFKTLPTADAIKIVRGNGERQLAIFEDPNCGYCKRFERDLQNVDNVTVYMFLYPILGRDSAEKSRNIWCAKDTQKTWHDLMLKDTAPKVASCDIDAIQRNLAFGRKHKITGTPTLIFADNTRIPGAIDANEVEKYISAAHKK